MTEGKGEGGKKVEREVLKGQTLTKERRGRTQIKREISMRKTREGEQHGRGGDLSFEKILLNK